VVQGVGYRDWTVRAARGLALVGWVRNLADGRVELWAEGPRAAVESLLLACREGPPRAHVQRVDARVVTPTGAARFERRPTTDVPHG
jgi:acylphosphatase